MRLQFFIWRAFLHLVVWLAVCKGDPPHDPYRNCPADDTSLSCPNACDPGWQFRDIECYLFTSNTKIWGEARDDCENKGGHLAVFETHAEEEWVRSRVNRQYWFGLHKMYFRWDPWQWIDGRSHTPGQGVSYWGPGQPDDDDPLRGENTACYKLYGSQGWMWDDFNSQHTLSYICEKRSPRRACQLSNCDAPCCLRLNPSGQMCTACNYNRGPAKRAYRLRRRDSSNSDCIKLCSWRSDSKFCFPGNCGTSCEPRECTCAENFANPSNNCMDVSRGPDVLFCNIEAIHETSRNQTEYKSIPCTNARSLNVGYVNIQLNQLKLDMQTRFIGLNYTVHGKPYFIKETRVGVVSVEASWKLYSSEGIHKASGNISDCGNSSRDNPKTLLSCEAYDNISASLSHKDRIEIIPTMQSGGYQIINNFDGGADNPTPGPRKYFTENHSTRTATVVLDFASPFHCSAIKFSTPCSHPIFGVGSHFTKKRNFTVRWEGWADDLAGIHGYELEIFSMVIFGDKLQRDSTRRQSQHVESGRISEVNVTLLEPGMYTLLLTVEDNTKSSNTGLQGNVRYARKFVLFDDQHVVEIQKENPIVVNSGTSNTSHGWIIDHVTPVGVSWKGRFCNMFHNNNKLLNGILNDSYPIGPGYQDVDGPQPPIRTMQPIPNVCAIVQYKIQWRLSKFGVKNITEPIPSNWHMVEPNQFQSETYRLGIPRTDGDTIRLFIQGVDILNTSAIDSVTVHVDSSRPVLEEIGLCKDDFCGLAVHNSRDITKMHFSFTAYDDHSGLQQAYWELHDAENTAARYSFGWPAVEKVLSDNCTPPSCACVPATHTCYNRNFTVKPNFQESRGEHGMDLFFWINVTNNAMLFTVKSLKLRIDLTPPYPGHVQDSQAGTPDLGFQASFIHHAHWQGFFDKESGVMFYQYGFSPLCIAKEDFALGSPKLHITNETYTKHIWNTTGTYYVTVVAYNHALDPSIPVCSDGLTFGQTPSRLYFVDTRVVVGVAFLAIVALISVIILFVHRKKLRPWLPQHSGQVSPVERDTIPVSLMSANSDGMKAGTK